MPKPSWRAYDSSPSREDDIRLSFLGFTLQASGRMVVLVILVIAASGLGVLHDLRSNEAHEVLAENFAVMTCVLTLSDPQKAEFRIEGKYCGNDTASYRVRRQVRPEATLK